MNRKVLIGFVCGCTLVFIISACATVKNFAGYFLHKDSKQGDDKKIAAFAKSMRPVKGNPDSHYLLARYYQERGKHWDAIIEFEKTLAIDPNHFKALNAMGVSYDFLKEFERSSECYEAALKLDPESANIYNNNIGQSLFQQGKYVAAIESFKKAAAYDEDFPDPRIHNNLGRAYAMTGQYDLALAEFERANDSATSAESILDKVLLDAERRNLASGTPSSNMPDETKAFSLRVAKFLEYRRVRADVSKEVAASANVPQKQLSLNKIDDFCVEVSNGNGIDFLARDMRDQLIRKGFRVSRVTNGVSVLRTYLYYEKGYIEQAKALARELPVAVKFKEVEALEVPQIKLRLLLGRDMIRHTGSPLQNPTTLNSWIGA